MSIEIPNSDDQVSQGVEIGASSNIADYYEMFDEQAKQQGLYRKWYQKLLGTGKAERDDIIEERANKYDQAIELELSSGNSKSIAEAIGKIEGREEFKLKSPERVEQEEFVKQKLLVVADSLAKNNFSSAKEKARVLLEQIEADKNIDSKIKQVFNEKLDQLFAGKLNDLLLQKEYDNFASALVELSSFREFNAGDFKAISPEILQSGDLVLTVKQKIIDEGKSNPYRFVSLRDMFSKVGLFSKDEINKLPEIVSGAKKNITEYPWDSYIFTQRRDLWAEAGVITVEEANKLPEIISGAKKHITEYPRDSYIFTQRRDLWAKAGVITVEDANKLSEIVAGAKKHITEYPRDSYIFTQRRDLWAKAGVITVEEANKLPEIVAGAKKHITEYPNDQHISDSRKQMWKDAGVIV